MTEEDVELVDKWAVIVGMPHESGDPSLHIHRIFDHERDAVETMKYLKGEYAVVFSQCMKCVKEGV